MSAQNDGGAAFPGGVNQTYTDMEPGEPTQIGMSLRDYFAARAMQMKFGPIGTCLNVSDMAKSCYEMADAMIAERAKTP